MSHILNEIIIRSVKDSIATKELLYDLSAEIQAAGAIMAEVLSNGGKILICGNGGSAADAQHFAGELVGRFLQERAGLPAIALNTDTSIITAIANDYGYAQVFSRQLQALGRPGDCFIGISTSGNSENVINAIKVARSQNMHIIALTGKQGGVISSLLTSVDHHLHVASQATPRIQEAHILLLHILCEVIDSILLGV